MVVASNSSPSVSRNAVLTSLVMMLELLNTQQIQQLLNQASQMARDARH